MQIIRTLRTRVACRLRRLEDLHTNERGTISILSVFTLLMFTGLLVFVMNAGTHLDDKLRMQNSADAAAYSGGVVLSRGMNAVAFSNHLLSDVFALTAFLREARDRHADPLTPEILAAWDRNAQRFSSAEFQKFRELGEALRRKTGYESELIQAYADLNEASAELSLPVIESILSEEMIPEFQRELVRVFPELAQQTVGEVAFRQGLLHRDLVRLGSGAVSAEPGERGPQSGVLFRMNGDQLGHSNEDDPMIRTIPAIDPTPTGDDYPLLVDANFYLTQAETQREELAVHYLEEWNSDKLVVFDRDAELSQFNNLWRIFTCAQLTYLLDVEYPETNLPMVIRHHDLSYNEVNLTELDSSTDRNQHLEENYHFVAIIYRPHMTAMGPRIFGNRLKEYSHAQTFAEVSLFVPRARYWWASGAPSEGDAQVSLGGGFGTSAGVDVPSSSGGGEPHWFRENWPSHWDMLNQNWVTKLVPATSEMIPTLLQTNPGDAVGGFRSPNYQNLSMEEINRVNTH